MEAIKLHMRKRERERESVSVCVCVYGIRKVKTRQTDTHVYFCSGKVHNFLIS